LEKSASMKYSYYGLAALLLLCLMRTSSYAQSREDSVKAAVNLLFTGMKASDAGIIRSAFAENAILQTIFTSKEGKTQVKTEALEDFAASISKLEKGVADERIQVDVVRIDGPLAIVWAPYSFYY